MDITARVKEVVGHIQRARSLAGYNQTAVAKYLGKKQPSISNWEKGRNLPNLKDIIIMCDLFSVTPNQLFGIVEDGAADMVTLPQPKGSLIVCSDGESLKITQEEESYLLKCLLKSRGMMGTDTHFKDE